jgi:hypothetical protein
MNHSVFSYVPLEPQISSSALLFCLIDSCRMFTTYVDWSGQKVHMEKPFYFGEQVCI